MQPGCAVRGSRAARPTVPAPGTAPCRRVGRGCPGGRPPVPAAVRARHARTRPRAPGPGCSRPDPCRRAPRTARAGPGRAALQPGAAAHSCCASGPRARRRSRPPAPGRPGPMPAASDAPCVSSPYRFLHRVGRRPLAARHCTPARRRCRHEGGQRVAARPSQAQLSRRPHRQMPVRGRCPRRAGRRSAAARPWFPSGCG